MALPSTGIFEKSRRSSKFADINLFASPASNINNVYIHIHYWLVLLEDEEKKKVHTHNGSLCTIIVAPNDFEYIAANLRSSTSSASIYMYLHIDSYRMFIYVYMYMYWFLKFADINLFASPASDINNVYINKEIYIDVYVCKWMYIYVYMYIHIYIYICMQYMYILIRI